jgi:uncharacterized protein (TIGR04255 family)
MEATNPNDSQWPLSSAPIVEAVLDIDCDLPPAADVDALEKAGRAALADQYPVVRRKVVSQHQIDAVPEQSVSVTSRHNIEAIQYVSQDGKQLVQFRPLGYSFNRLAPYSSLDDYLPEIERCWRIFVSVGSPVLTRVVRMRYINRMALPLVNGRMELDEYFHVAPQLADEHRLTLTGFFDQQSVLETDTGNRAAIVLATQSVVDDHLQVIFDIEASRELAADPGDWRVISETIASLRALKNLVFRNSLTPKCLNLFRP